jgi:hypothetical protein
LTSHIAWAIGRGLVDTENWAFALRRKLISSSALSIRNSSDILRSSVAASANLSTETIIEASALRWVYDSIIERECGINSPDIDSRWAVSSEDSISTVGNACGNGGCIGVAPGNSGITVLLNGDAALARLEESVSIAACALWFDGEIDLSDPENILIIAIAVISSATSCIIDVEARALLSSWVDSAHWCWGGQLNGSSAARALERCSASTGSISDGEAIAVGEVQVVVVSLNWACSSCAVAHLSAVNSGEALASGELHSSGRVDSIAYGGDWGGDSISNAASAVVQVSALALILSKTSVSEVENCEVSGESGAGAVLIESSCGRVQGAIGAWALRSGLVSQANLLSCSLNCELSEAASASSSIANATIAGRCKISHCVSLALIIEAAVASLLHRSTQGSVGALAVVLS